MRRWEGVSSLTLRLTGLDPEADTLLVTTKPVAVMTVDVKVG
jgi:hypothetical protein